MEQGLSGGTTNLLRMARTGCQSGSSFVALALADDSFATAVYPATYEPGAVDVPTVDAIVRQLWHDPGFGRGKALVRTVRIGDDRLAVAAVPLAMNEQGQPSGLLGVADPGGRAFGVPDLELLSRIAQRLTSYVRARRAVRSQFAPTGQPAEPVPAAEPVPTAQPFPAPEAVPAPGSPTAHIPATGASRAPSAAPAGVWLGQKMDSGLSPPPFPPPAGTAGPERPVAFPAPPAPEPRDAGRPAPAPVPSPHEPSVRSILGDEDEIPGLVPLGALLGRAGRLLGAGTATSGSLALVALEVEGAPHPSREEVATVANAIRNELRFDDPLARIDDLTFVAVVPLAPGASTAAQLEAHLAARVRAGVAQHPGMRVHAAHVVAPLDGGQDADELLRAAVVKLRAR